MKFNLKNRPYVSNPTIAFTTEENIDRLEAERQNLIEWFEGFEKELRELLTGTITDRRRVTEATALWNQGRRIVMEEILGETK